MILTEVTFAELSVGETSALERRFTCRARLVGRNYTQAYKKTLR